MTKAKQDIHASAVEVELDTLVRTNQCDEKFKVKVNNNVSYVEDTRASETKQEWYKTGGLPGDQVPHDIQHLARHNTKGQTCGW